MLWKQKARICGLKEFRRHNDHAKFLNEEVNTRHRIY